MQDILISFNEMRMCVFVLNCIMFFSYLERNVLSSEYLLNNLFDLEHFPTEDPASTEDDNFTYEPMRESIRKVELAALNELCASVLYPPSWPLLCLSSQRRSILQSNYSRLDIPASSKRLSLSKTKRYHRQNHERPFTQKGFLHP